MASNLEGIAIAASLAAQAAKKVAEKAALQAGNAATDVKPQVTTTATKSTIKPPAVPNREPKADTTSFSKGQPKAETTTQTPDPGDQVSLKAPIKPSPVPKRTPPASTILDSPPPVPLRNQTISPPKEALKVAQQPLKGDAAEEAFLAKWEADPSNKGKKLPAALEAVANRRRIEQLDKAIAENDALIAQAQNDKHDHLEKLYIQHKQILVNEKNKRQINTPLDVPVSSTAATKSRKSSAIGSLLEKTGLRKSSTTLENS